MDEFFRRNLKYYKTEASNLSIDPQDLLSISKFLENIPHHINKVLKSDDRIILTTKGGVPLVGIVPLWMLVMLEEHTSVMYDYDFFECVD